MAALDAELSVGFKDSVHDAQRVFRTIMQAFSYPASARPFEPGLAAAGDLRAETAAVLLTLADFDTPVWLDDVLSGCAATRAFLRFHCGCPVTTDPREAAFAVVADAAHMPKLGDFAQGSAEYPDRSTTVILQVRDFAAQDWRFEGPGLKAPQTFRFSPAPANFPDQWRSNRLSFPLGVDLILAGTQEIAVLPRSLNMGSD